MTNDKCLRPWRLSSFISLSAALGVLLSVPSAVAAQGPGTENAEWTFLGGDAWHTRYTPATEITADNFEHLTRVAWHLGNRHLPAAISADRILIRPDHVIESMVIGLDASIHPVTEPFQPEYGAYHEHRHSPSSSTS